MRNSKACIFTIASKNYLAHARTLLKSSQKYNAGIDTVLLLADKIDGHFEPIKEPFKVIEAEELGIPEFDSFSFKYNILEFNTAVKPYAFDYLFEKFAYEKILYLDPDILIFSSLDEIFDLLETYTIVLTPHLTTPLPDDGRIPEDLDIIRGGVFNLGFLGLANNDKTSGLLAWWKRKLYDQCLIAPSSGYMVDQSWMSLVPCITDNYFIQKNSGYNLSYWNLHERKLEKRGEYFFVNGSPLLFYHYSGFIMEQKTRLSKYQNRFTLDEIPNLNELFGIYAAELDKNGYSETSGWPYKYGFFKNGRLIKTLHRTLYLSCGAGTNRFKNPYEAFWRKYVKNKPIRAILNKYVFFKAIDEILGHLWKLFKK